MKYLVTGGAGFIGSHLTDKLLAEGHTVHVLDDMSTGVMENLAEAKKSDKFLLIEEPIQFVGELYELPETYDAVFHLAAMARIQPSFDDPVKTYWSNAFGTMTMLDAARKTGARFIYSGSSTFYFDPYVNPYAFAKWQGELSCQMYARVYDVPVGVARFFNVYGPRQIEEGDYSTVIGVFEKQRREGESLTVTGTGEQRRDFTHVDDIVSGLIAIDEQFLQTNKYKTASSSYFALGTGENHSINEVAVLFAGCKVEHIPARPGEADTTLADIQYTKDTLGWKPTHTLEDYIKNVVGD
jgi:UDP-glucose 4-epimerase